MPYHVSIEVRGELYPEVKLDLTPDKLEALILSKYRAGQSILCNGRIIAAKDVDRLHISFTEQPSRVILPTVRREREAENDTFPASDEWYVVSQGRDVTDDLLAGPLSVTGERVLQGPDGGDQDPRLVFIVHGRNDRAREALFGFLRAIGLSPMEWSELVASLGKGSPYVGEILDTAFSKAQAVLVLMTPDDKAFLRKPLRQKSEPVHETQPTNQARPNVLFEAGMAFGRFPDRTVLVELGDLRPFSDVGGRHVIRLTNTSQRRQELAHRLRAVGCSVNLDGTDWHTSGDFEGCLRLDDDEFDT